MWKVHFIRHLNETQDILGFCHLFGMQRTQLIYIDTKTYSFIKAKWGQYIIIFLLYKLLKAQSAFKRFHSTYIWITKPMFEKQMRDLHVNLIFLMSVYMKESLQQYMWVMLIRIYALLSPVKHCIAYIIHRVWWNVDLSKSYPFYLFYCQFLFINQMCYLFVLVP